MNKYRFCYQKRDEVKFVSHLDFIRVVERALKRAHLPVSHSQGFNPHPKMAVAVPLSVGVTSLCDYMDITFDEPQELSTLMDTLNRALPPGFRIIEIQPIGELAKFKYIDRAEYHIHAEYLGTLPDIEGFMAQEQIVVAKKSKRALKDVDIKPLLFDVHLLSQEGDTLTLYAKMAAGEVNVKPSLLIDAIKQYDPSYHGEYLSACRIALYASTAVCF